PVSVDTTKSTVAAAALQAGAVIVNDVSAGRRDPEMLRVVAGAGAGFVAVHMLGEPRPMPDEPRYGHVVDEGGAFLGERIDAAHTAGVADASIMVDPGIGFGKTVAHNLTLLADLPRLVARVERPVLIGTSRKWFIGRILGIDQAEARDDGTLATVVW